MTKFEEVDQSLLELNELMSKKEKKVYEKDTSLDEIVTYKIILDTDKDCDVDKLEKEFPDLMLVTKEKKLYNWYFSNIKEDNFEELIKKIDGFLLSDEDKEEIKRLEEDSKIQEELRLERVLEENALEHEIRVIFANKYTIREIKEACEDIEQIIYRLKNQVNFMTFYYLITKDKNITYEMYSKVFDWYMNLSEKYIEYKKIDIEYRGNSSEYFESQLETVTKEYQLLYYAWKLFQAEKKITENNFGNIKEKLPREIIIKVSKENIFIFRKEMEE